MPQHIIRLPPVQKNYHPYGEDARPLQHQWTQQSNACAASLTAEQDSGARQLAAPNAFNKILPEVEINSKG